MTDLADKTILVAEDDPVNMMIAVKMLETKKARVIKAINGTEALKKLFSETTTDLVLLDLEMPELDGYHTIKKIREQFDSLPVIAFTAYCLDKQMEKTLSRHGFTDSIPKPFKPEIFYNKIHKAFEKIHH